MNQLLFERSTGGLSPQDFSSIQISRNIHSLQAAPQLCFNGGEREAHIPTTESTGPLEDTTLPESPKVWAHQAGVSCLALDIDSRFLVSGGADSTIRIWDTKEKPTGSKFTFRPVGSVLRTASSHRFGITQLSFYPFDAAAFLSSSYDHHLKLYDTDRLSVSADFDLNSIVYTHALSPIASHLLVACATQHPAVRLVDLRSGSSTHSLAGHHGALLSLCWSPTVEHILASGGTDGTVRLWDIRKASGALGVLDLEDSTGIVGVDGMGLMARRRERGKSHTGAVNGIAWTDDGSYIVTSGHDDRARVWDAMIGANTLASFGPTLKNRHLSTLPLLLSSTSFTGGKPLLFYPNEKELLVFGLHDGNLLKRLKIPGPSTAAVKSITGERNIRNRITSLVWQGQCDAIFSGHTDGQIRVFIPRTAEDDILDKEEERSKRHHEEEDETVQRKRQVLNDVFRDLTRQKISFG